MCEGKSGFAPETSQVSYTLRLVTYRFCSHYILHFSFLLCNAVADGNGEYIVLIIFTCIIVFMMKCDQMNILNFVLLMLDWINDCQPKFMRMVDGLVISLV